MIRPFVFFPTAHQSKPRNVILLIPAIPRIPRRNVHRVAEFRMSSKRLHTPSVNTVHDLRTAAGGTQVGEQHTVVDRRTRRVEVAETVRGREQVTCADAGGCARAYGREEEGEQLGDVMGEGEGGGGSDVDVVAENERALGSGGCVFEGGRRRRSGS